jgi:hypothetical protein
MNRVGPIPHEGAITPAQDQHLPQTSPPPAIPAQPADRVELSAAARREPSTPDAKRIAEIRARIADDTYLTPEKLEAAIKGLYRDALRAP